MSLYVTFNHPEYETITLENPTDLMLSMSCAFYGLPPEFIIKRVRRKTSAERTIVIDVPRLKAYLGIVEEEDAQ